MNGQYEKKLLLFLALFSFLFVFISNHTAMGDASTQKVYVIPVSGNVEPGMAAFLKRAFRDISDDTESLVVIEMDTFGGRVDSALDMVDTLLNVSKSKTIAFVANKAISAGALIALACNELVMKKNTTIGDCAPITYSEQGPKMMGEKFQSPLRAKFRTLAKRNGYPVKLAESMVTAEMEVYEVKMAGKTRYMDSREFEELSPEEKKRVQSKRTVVAKGELLTMDDAEAHELGFSRMSVSNMDEMLQKMGITDYELIRIQETWSETLVRFIGSIAPILMMIGLAALYIEIKAPGFGLPGLVGITCLALVFLNQYLVGLADYTELLFIMTGMVLLGFELFVTPGFGVAGFLGLICISLGMTLGFQDFVIPDPSLPWQKELLINNITQVLGAFLCAFVLSLIFLQYIFPKLSKIIKGPYLDATLETAHADSREAGAVSVGNTGIVMTSLRPSGKVKINGEVFDVVTQGEFMNKGTLVKVMEIKGNRIIVSKGPYGEK